MKMKPASFFISYRSTVIGERTLDIDIYLPCLIQASSAAFAMR